MHVFVYIHPIEHPRGGFVTFISIHRSDKFIIAIIAFFYYGNLVITQILDQPVYLEDNSAVVSSALPKENIYKQCQRFLGKGGTSHPNPHDNHLMNKDYLGAIHKPCGQIFGNFGPLPPK